MVQLNTHRSFERLRLSLFTEILSSSWDRKQLNQSAMLSEQAARLTEKDKFWHRRYTNVWMKHKGKWLLTARHANVICPN